ncbi:hypothetical protein HI914_00622 [Erysiphe necator]|nr:hypothetical protein HI914_00622 [Erysiphe necator]
MSDSGKGKSSSSSGQPNIFSLNKKLNDSLADIDTKFENLTKTIELGHANTNGRTEKIEQWLTRTEKVNLNTERRMDRIEEANHDIRKILIQIQNSLSSLENQLNSQTPPNIKYSESQGIKQPPKAEESKKMKENRETPIPSFIPNDKHQLTDVERFVKETWPEALLDRDIDHHSFTSAKNKVVLKPEWRLTRANTDVFDKLSEIQSALRTALVPYYLWPERLTYEMSDDFKGIRVWATECKQITWVDMLNAIFKNLEMHDCLHNLLTTFASMNPTNDSIESFARRLRDSFYRLPRNDRSSSTVQFMITDLCSRYLPRVWTIAEPVLFNLRNDQRIEKIVQIARRVSRWDDEYNKFQKNSVDPSLPLTLASSHTDPKLYTIHDNQLEQAYVSNNDITSNPVLHTPIKPLRILTSPNPIHKTHESSSPATTKSNNTIKNVIIPAHTSSTPTTYTIQMT